MRLQRFVYVTLLTAGRAFATTPKTNTSAPRALAPPAWFQVNEDAPDWPVVPVLLSEAAS